MTVYLVGPAPPPPAPLAPGPTPPFSESSESPPSCGAPEYLDEKIETYGEAEMGGAGGGAGSPAKRALTTSAIGGGGGWVFRLGLTPVAVVVAVVVVRREDVPGGVWGWSVYLDDRCADAGAGAPDGVSLTPAPVPVRSEVVVLEEGSGEETCRNDDEACENGIELEENALGRR